MSNKILPGIFIGILFSLISLNIFSQAPPIEWQRCYGGTAADRPTCLEQTSDGGYIVAGFSQSNNGDVPSNHGSLDFCVMKLTATGDVDWVKSLGGSGSEDARSIQQTTDGGYIIAGTTISSNGDVWGKHEDSDCWIVKLNSNGDTAWTKTLGGDSSEAAQSIQQTLDGGYIVAGSSNSINGDVTGNHGSTDCWIVKLNSSGAIVWEKSFGGTNGDGAISIQQTTDGGYIVGGDSNSSDGDLTSNHGVIDYWIIKLTGAGDLVWQKSFGGSSTDQVTAIQQTTDSGYIVAGYSTSNDGDVTNHHASTDFWIIKLDNSGTLTWQKSIGSSGDNRAYSIRQTFDGGYIIAGFAGTPADGDLTVNYGFYDDWVVKISATGVIEWQKALGGNNFDQAADIRQTSDYGYIIAGYTNSNNNNDVGANHGGSDFWIVKLAADPLPVKSGQLHASLQSQSVLCNWQTYQEQNSNHFSIERSDDAIHFKNIGTVAAAGNSQVQLNYSFTDKTAFETGSENLYYRLKIIDNDGSFSYSNVANVKLNYAAVVNIYPNPVVHELHASFISTEAGSAIIQIIDAAGKKVYEQNRLIQKGKNIFSINVSFLIAGSYILTVKGKDNYFGRFIKVAD